MKISGKVFYSFLVLIFMLSAFMIPAEAKKGQSTELTHDEQVAKDDEILSKDIKDLTPEELERLNQIKKAKQIKRSGYEKRAAKALVNEQPKTVEEYEKMSTELKNSELQDFNPKFKKDPRLAKAPEIEVQTVRYNYPGGSRELDLTKLKTERHVNSIGVLSPDEKMVVYSDVNYDVGMRKASSNVYIIPAQSEADREQKKQAFLKSKQEQLRQLNEEIVQNKNLTETEKWQKKKKKKELSKEIKQIQKEKEQEALTKATSPAPTPSQRIATILMQAHIKDKIKTPILSSGTDDAEYGVQRTLTVVDWSLDSKKILIKEKILKEGEGLWQTNMWVYDFETNQAKRLDEVRQALEYYWKKDRLVDLYYYRFDIYPLGWDAKHPDRVLLYAYGYTKESSSPPKFLGTWSIDYKGEQSQLISMRKTDYILQANGYCLKTKNLEFYER